MIFLENLVLLDKLESKWLLIDYIRGTHGDKKGTAFVVYEDIYDAKNAFDNLSGFNVAGRYIKYFNINSFLDIWLCYIISHKKCRKDRTLSFRESK